MKKAFFLLISAFLLLNGCSKKETIDAVLIRVKNASTLTFTNVYVNTSGGENNYGDLAAGQISEYKEFTYAYPYAYVRFEIDGQTRQLQPIDYVGESLLDNGKYTYELTVDPVNGNVGLVLTE